MKILIVKLSAIGDVVHTMPLVAAIRKKFPQAMLSWLVEEEAADILFGYENIDNLFISPRKSAIKALQAGKWKEGWQMLKEFIGTLRTSGQYDIIIDAHGLFKSAVLVGLLDAKCKLGYASLQEGSGLFYTKRIPEDLTKHAVDRYLDFAVYLGAKSSVAEFSINTKSIDIDTLLAEKGIILPKNFIAMSPHALWQTKLWDDGKFAALADMIREKLAWQVVLTGRSRRETEQVEKLAKSDILNVGGATTLRELAALYRRAALVVSTDSGPMHIAAAVGTPVVALFGPTDAKRTGPYGERHTVISAPVECRPCLRKKCHSPICMKGIDVEEVFFAVEKQISSRYL